MKNPCDKNCEERNGECHATCKRYKIYEEWNMARLKEKAKQYTNDMYFFDRQETANKVKIKRKIKSYQTKRQF